MSNCEEEEPSREVLFDQIEKQFFCGNNKELQSLPDEGLRIIKDKLKDIRACSTRQTYELNLDEALDVIRTFYSYLDTNPKPTRQRKCSVKYDVKGASRKLWFIYPLDLFASGSEHWDDPGQHSYFVYTPFNLINIDDCVSIYLGKRWIRHQYISWALINIYLIHSARLYLMECDQQYNRSDLTKLFLLKYQNLSSVVGSIFVDVLEPFDKYERFVSEVKSVYPRATIVFIFISIIVSAMIRHLSDHYVLANVFLCIGVSFSLWDLKYSVRYNNRKLSDIDNMRNKLIAMKDAWVAANCETVDLTRIKDKVFIVESLGYRYSPRFHALLTDTIARHGDTLSVKAWVGY